MTDIPTVSDIIAYLDTNPRDGTGQCVYHQRGYSPTSVNPREIFLVRYHGWVRTDGSAFQGDISYDFGVLRFSRWWFNRRRLQAACERYLARRNMTSTSVSTTMADALADRSRIIYNDTFLKR